MRKKILPVGIVVGVAAALTAFTPAMAISSTSADLSVLHGIPDTPVDVYVNGELTIDDFQPGSLAGPLDLPAGSYEVALTATDAADASAPVLGPITLDLEAGKSYTAVAHLAEVCFACVRDWRLPMSHSDPDLAALLALGEREPSEEERAHLDSCVVCAEDVEAFRRLVVAGRAGAEGALLTPPARVWDAIASEIATVPDAGYREVWLIADDGSDLVSLGVLDGARGEFAVPDDVDLKRFTLVDVSQEETGGDPGHSGNSIVRGSLVSASSLSRHPRP